MLDCIWQLVPSFQTIVIIFFVYWISVSLFAARMIKKIFRKYPKDIKPVQNINKQWEAFRRDDYSKWNRRDILLGAFIRWPLNLSHIVTLFVCLFGIPIAMFLNAVSGSIYLGNIFYYHIVRRLNWFILNYFTTIRIIEEGQFPKYIKTPLIVCNHVNWWDIFYISYRHGPFSFVAKSQVGQMPIIGHIAKFIQCIFVKRDKMTNRDNIVQKIKQRVQQFETRKSNYDVYPLMIFPQGTNSNGKSIIRFKLGAFQNRTPISVFCLSYQTQNFQGGMDQIPQSAHVFLYLCQSNVLRVKHFTMECGEKETAQQYMHRCQKMMAQKLGFPIYDVGFRQYCEYEKICQQQRFGKKLQ